MDIEMPEKNGLDATFEILEYYKKINKKPPPIVNDFYFFSNLFK
jgi:hypothetical protein